MKKLLLVFAISVCISSALKAQNFSGHFTMESRDVMEGTGYINAIAVEMTITQTKDSIIIVRVTPMSEEETTTSTETLPLNGKEIVTMVSSNRKRVSSIKFDKEKGTATIITTLSYAGKPGEIEYKNTETWSIDGDKNMTITKISDATVTDDWTVRGVFKGE